MSVGYELIRSSRKTLAIEITRDARVLVRAPRLCPKAYIDRFVNSREVWIAEHLSRQESRAEAHPEPDEARRAELIEKARAYLPERVDHYAALMGLAPAGITITSAKTRFGSCSAKNRLSFSWRLMDYPTEAVDYVVVHELAHIVHKNHGAEFYALIAAHLPDWRARREMLKN